MVAISAPCKGSGTGGTPLRKVYIYPGAGEFGDRCAELCRAAGFVVTDDPNGVYLALAPLLTRKLSGYEWSTPMLGTLIFHPSALPYHRGPDAIRWVVQLGEHVSGATWFWCDGGLDTGPICEQETVVMKIGESPGRAYHTRFIPAALRALERALAGIQSGSPRSVEQDESAASYESFYARPAAAV
jgi:formyltetrahydrofolate dehydrogenase